MWLEGGRAHWSASTDECDTASRDAALRVEIFGHVVQAVDACLEWDALYCTAVLAQKKYSSRPWSFERTPIFAHADAFVQRCRRE